MRAEREIQKKIDQKRQEIQELKVSLERAQAYLDALQESLRLFQRSSSDTGSGSIRANSQVDRARQILAEFGKPLHVSEILKRMGKDNTKQNRISLSGSIGFYVRQHEVFTRPSPNTFGLLEFDDSPSNGQIPIPEGFGRD